MRGLCSRVSSLRVRFMAGKLNTRVQTRVHSVWREFVRSCARHACMQTTFSQRTANKIYESVSISNFILLLSSYDEVLMEY